MGNDLYSGTKIFAPALLVQHVPVNLSGGQIGILVQILIDEPLIVTQIQIRFGAILGHIDLTVLVGAHGSGVHVDIGVQLLGCHLQPPGLQQATQRGCGNSLAQAGYHAAGYKNILCHVLFLSFPGQPVTQPSRIWPDSWACQYRSRFPWPRNTQEAAAGQSPPPG